MHLKKTGLEQFCSGGSTLDFNLLDFWRWTGSNLLGNLYRGWLAEYLVARALDAQQDLRQEWAAYDVSWRGLRLEVKSAAYLQAWKQRAPSKILFSIKPSKPDASVNPGLLLAPHGRHSHIYVFALLHHQDIGTIDPLDVTQWTFLALPTSILNKQCPSQSTIALRKLESLGAQRSDFFTLRAAVEALAIGDDLPLAPLGSR